ncbi:MAG: ribonuclease Z [Planctomycetes bacterium]|nr:ribonuclease Z [Planctomycetota bacterium]
MRITILGTSSATPTFKRALSATLVEREGESFLFDCGEGTQYQLMRAGARRGRLGTILVTHLHGDHYYGLPGLLSSLGLNQREQALQVIGPAGIGRFVDFIQNFPRRFSLPFELTCRELPTGFEGVVLETDELRIVSAPLDHRLPTQGYRLEEKPRPGSFDAARADELGIPFGPERGRLIRGETITLADGRVIEPADLVGPPRPGRSFAYCTDTRLCLGAKRLAQDVDLLLHEATYGEEFWQLAEERRHSTIRQAAVLARAAGARTFVATHFSTRYDREKIKELEDEARAVLPDAILATDLMTIEI